MRFSVSVPVLSEQDHIDAADGLTGDHLFHQRVLFGPLDDVEGQRDGHDGGQTLRHRGHNQHNAGDEGVRDGEQGSGTGGYKADELNEKDDGCHSGTQNCNALAEHGQFFLQRRAALGGVGEGLGDLAELSMVADSRNHHAAIAAR